MIFGARASCDYFEAHCCNDLGVFWFSGVLSHGPFGKAVDERAHFFFAPGLDCSDGQSKHDQQGKLNF